MILEMVINIITEILKILLNIAMLLFPQINLSVQLTEMLGKILTITTQANNMIHFIIGDFVAVLVPLTIALLMFKYVVYPIITLLRSVFASGNN